MQQDTGKRGPATCNRQLVLPFRLSSHQRGLTPNPRASSYATGLAVAQCKHELPSFQALDAAFGGGAPARKSGLFMLNELVWLT